MEIKKIKLAYRIVIDSSSNFLWDKYVFEDTFKEYQMQSQQFNSDANPKNTFRELLAENEKAEKLHFLVGIAASGYVEQLKGKFHRVADTLGNNYFPFINYQLDIINTDRTDVSKHKIGITFYSPLLSYFGIVEGNYLISMNSDDRNEYETIMFPVQKNLSICYIKNN
ncbi:hypothetical protein EYY60_02030 [Flavobacterium zhairuonense]|uniref:hypothetical protein n=1 Tax=Flavobacterium zhairuonense TaxID=2493631 RepID=UPI001053B2AC|nr:hypothetical protein [Flavobacterium zhairuonense]KAF2515475.1 hypothetical protein EYY60_02030 [Flavobacterium zhairuonense]